MSTCVMFCGSEPARAGDAVAITSHPGNSNTFDRVLGVFAESYADKRRT